MTVMIKRNASVLKYVTLSGNKIKLLINQVKNDVSVITKVVAIPILKAVITFLDMPINEHKPKHCISAKLSINTLLMNKII